jgi:hypothetical protein
VTPSHRLAATTRWRWRPAPWPRARSPQRIVCRAQSR